MELGYALPLHSPNVIRLVKQGSTPAVFNLLLLSSLKDWDVEMGGNGLGYPPKSDQCWCSYHFKRDLMKCLKISIVLLPLAIHLWLSLPGHSAG